MMTADKFEIRTDARRGMLRITLRGHWSVETVLIYKQAIAHAAADLYAAGCKRGELLALVDARSGGAQSQDVIAAYQRELGTDNSLAPRRLATLVSSALFKRQVQRIAIQN